jgi:hypothetical protein
MEENLERCLKCGTRYRYYFGNHLFLQYCPDPDNAEQARRKFLNIIIDGKRNIAKIYDKKGKRREPC